MTDEEKRLQSACAIERALGVRHGVIHALEQQGRIKPVWLPDHKRPKYDKRAVLRALGVTDETC